MDICVSYNISQRFPVKKPNRKNVDLDRDIGPSMRD